jgi:hypothetical protein
MHIRKQKGHKMQQEYKFFHKEMAKIIEDENGLMTREETENLTEKFNSFMLGVYCAFNWIDGNRLVDDNPLISVPKIWQKYFLKYDDEYAKYLLLKKKYKDIE